MQYNVSINLQCPVCINGPFTNKRLILFVTRSLGKVIYNDTPPQKSGQDFAPSQVENVIMRRFY
jgi:hypothetical protein